jgi:adenine deaminase
MRRGLTADSSSCPSGVRGSIGTSRSAPTGCPGKRLSFSVSCPASRDREPGPGGEHWKGWADGKRQPISGPTAPSNHQEGGRSISRRNLIDVALGKTPAEKAILNGRIVNVSTCEIYEAGIAITGDRIAAVGDIDYACGPDTEVIDAAGRYVTPGLIDGHLHMYHTYMGVNEFVEVMLKHGVTSTADGFYGQGIVGGKEAIRFFKQAFDERPLRLIFLVPTLAYLQNRELGLEPAPGIGVDDMTEMLDWDGCLGLEEPPFLPIVDKWDEFLDLFESTLAQRKTITGHAAGIGWREMQAYAAMGTSTDHETVATSEALDKARAGVKLLMRQGSGAFDVPAVVKAYTEHGIDPRILAFCADLASTEKLVKEGGVDENVRVAIANGVPPGVAVQMGTINVAEAFNIQHDVGVLAPGRYADILLVEDLVDFVVQRVMVGGETVVDEGDFVGDLPSVTYPGSFYGTVKLERALSKDDFEVPVDGRDEVEIRVIGITEGSLETDQRRARMKVKDGYIAQDFDNDILPLTMVDRFQKGSGRIGVGFVQGFGLRAGAIASSVNAVCENLVAVGANTSDMAVALNKLAEIGGGKIVVVDGEILALVELRLLGLLSDEPLGTMTSKFDKALKEIANLGCPLRNPFSQLEFCFACGEIGDLRLSDEGLLRVNPPESVELIVT